MLKPPGSTRNVLLKKKNYTELTFLVLSNDMYWTVLSPSLN